VRKSSNDIAKSGTVFSLFSAAFVSRVFGFSHGFTTTSLGTLLSASCQVMVILRAPDTEYINGIAAGFVLVRGACHRKPQADRKNRFSSDGRSLLSRSSRCHRIDHLDASKQLSQLNPSLLARNAILLSSRLLIITIVDRTQQQTTTDVQEVLSRRRMRDNKYINQSKRPSCTRRSQERALEAFHFLSVKLAMLKPPA
jgi:hypothetical protein